MSYGKHQLDEDSWAYVFFHKDLGVLGRLLLTQRQDGQTHVSCKVAGDLAQPETQHRLAILEPVTTDLVDRMNAKLEERA